MLFTSRIRDDKVRDLADRLRIYVHEIASSPDEATADGRLLVAGNTQQTLIQRIGQLVRELDDEAT
jgi:hypothetical protein